MASLQIRTSQHGIRVAEEPKYRSGRAADIGLFHGNTQFDGQSDEPRKRLRRHIPGVGAGGRGDVCGAAARATRVLHQLQPAARCGRLARRAAPGRRARAAHAALWARAAAPLPGMRSFCAPMAP